MVTMLPDVLRARRPIRLFCVILIALVGCADRAWNTAVRMNTREAYVEFQERYPEDPRAIADAPSAIAELDWARALQLDSEAAYEEFLSTHPVGSSADEARSRIADLREKATQTAQEQLVLGLLATQRQWLIPIDPQQPLVRQVIGLGAKAALIVPRVFTRRRHFMLLFALGQCGLELKGRGEAETEFYSYSPVGFLTDLLNGDYMGMGMDLRPYAAEALGKMGAEREAALRAIREILFGSDEPARDYASRAVAAFAPWRSDVVDIVVAALTSERREVQKAGEWAFRHMTRVEGNGLALAVGPFLDACCRERDGFGLPGTEFDRPTLERLGYDAVPAMLDFAKTTTDEEVIHDIQAIIRRHAGGEETPAHGDFDATDPPLEELEARKRALLARKRAMEVELERLKHGDNSQE